MSSLNKIPMARDADIPIYKSLDKVSYSKETVLDFGKRIDIQFETSCGRCKQFTIREWMQDHRFGMYIAKCPHSSHLTAICKPCNCLDFELD